MGQVLFNSDTFYTFIIIGKIYLPSNGIIMKNISYKKDFQKWRSKQEAAGYKFYDSLPEITDLKVGELVMFTNPAGIVFGPHEILCFCEPDNDRCVYIDYDCYWFPAKPETLTALSKFYPQSLKKLVSCAEQFDWTIKTGDHDIELSKYSSQGQDFSFCIPLNSIHSNEIFEFYDNYDPSEEALKWVDASGHGINGAPYYLEDIIADMKDIKDDIFKLYKSLIYSL